MQSPVPVNVTYYDLASALTLCSQWLIVFVVNINAYCLHLPGGVLPILKARGNYQQPEQSHHGIQMHL